MSDPSLQLQRELESSISTALTARRPILSHINADTTWLLSLPYPEGAICPPRRCRFNILLDPWLVGPQSDIAEWFSTQWHRIQSSVQTIEELNDFLCEREELELHALEGSMREKSEDSDTTEPYTSNYIDAVICSHEFTDHCHQKTLEEIDPSVPCFATTKAAELIRAWGHFKQVLDISSFGKDSDWRQTSKSPLPPWIGIARLVTESDALYLHSAVAIFVQDTRSLHPHGAEAVIYSPHGIEPLGLDSIPTATPPIQTLTLLHGLHDISIAFTKQLNLGAINALKCQRLLKARYWAGTHGQPVPKMNESPGTDTFFDRRGQDWRWSSCPVSAKKGVQLARCCKRPRKG